jgi:hypothetical protein
VSFILIINLFGSCRVGVGPAIGKTWFVTSFVRLLCASYNGETSNGGRVNMDCERPRTGWHPGGIMAVKLQASHFYTQDSAWFP